MLSYSLTFLIVALVAGLLGFGVVAGTAASIAKILFFVSIVLFLVSLVGGRLRPRSDDRRRSSGCSLQEIERTLRNRVVRYDLEHPLEGPPCAQRVSACEQQEAQIAERLVVVRIEPDRCPESALGAHAVAMGGECVPEVELHLRDARSERQ